MGRVSKRSALPFVLYLTLISGLGGAQGTICLTLIFTPSPSFPRSYYSLGGSFHEHAFLRDGCVVLPDLRRNQKMMFLHVYFRILFVLSILVLSSYAFMPVNRVGVLS